ncbi:uncharacterized protein LOC141587140 [Silene latifolia]|uniref:uncharacterized protein LOC141587140 n=1 Tax=Silene latifolia TaxID=37657 RepID=UPI003D77833D
MGHLGSIGCSLTVCRGNILKKSAYFYKRSHGFSVIGRCNELILVTRNVRHRNTGYQKVMILCNPSIRKSLLIPPCPIGDSMYVLGFAPRSKDYKIVAISVGRNQDEEPRKTSVVVYTLSDQQWRIRNNVVDISCWEIKSRVPKVFYFQGAAHWFGNTNTHLVSLDFDSEKVTSMEIPNALNETKTMRFLFLLGKSLAIFSISKERSGIWVLEQGKGRLLVIVAV